MRIPTKLHITLLNWSKSSQFLHMFIAGIFCPSQQLNEKITTIQKRNSTMQSLIVQVHKEQILHKKTISASNENGCVASVTKDREEKGGGCGWKCVSVRGGHLNIWGDIHPQHAGRSLSPCHLLSLNSKGCFKATNSFNLSVRESAGAQYGWPPCVLPHHRLQSFLLSLHPFIPLWLFFNLFSVSVYCFVKRLPP